MVGEQEHRRRCEERVCLGHRHLNDDPETNEDGSRAGVELSGVEGDVEVGRTGVVAELIDHSLHIVGESIDVCQHDLDRSTPVGATRDECDLWRSRRAPSTVGLLGGLFPQLPTGGQADVGDHEL